MPQWFESCFDRALAYNLQFPAPLGENEVKAIARSISKWTYQRFNASVFSRIQAIRCAKGGRMANIAKRHKNSYIICSENKVLMSH
ncbi:primase C-terminal domain-containing protein [Candidatus Williamhamiltonella defendens]|uniref:primase C-terminal domain-containing protein n=1 Tax=Candidatus Williamhamiltonella defendens TaxID=138072 RepID=UPI00387E65C8